MQPTNNLPDPPTQANLTTAELAESIRADLEAIASADQDKLARAFAIGAKLIKAKDQVPTGTWRAWLRTNCKLKERLAESYMQLARGRAVIESQSSAIRSIAAALKYMRVRNGVTSPPPKAKVAPNSSKAAPLTSLTWTDATPEERRKCLNGASPESFFKAIPPTWRAESLFEELPHTWRTPIEERALEHAGARTLIGALERKLSNNPAACEALQALHKALQPPLETQAPAQRPRKLTAKPTLLSENAFDAMTAAAAEEHIDACLRWSADLSIPDGERSLTNKEWARVDRWRKKLKEKQKTEAAIERAAALSGPRVTSNFGAVTS